MQTVLNSRHRTLGAKMVDFCGWEMPIQYQGVIQEHQTVRQKVGLFDVSHMGRILVSGPDAEAFLDYISTNTITGKPDFSSTYTVWSNAEAGCIDDVIVYKQDLTHYFVIANAGNREKDLQHLQQEGTAFQVQIEDRYKEDGILALQGPRSEKVILQLFPEAEHLKHMHFTLASYQGQEVILSRTGYTGADGFELYTANQVIPALWDQLLAIGQPDGIMPIGLGARDTLRLEMGYALYGHEINEEIAPNESVSAWTVKWKKEDFLGKEEMERIEESPLKRSEHGIILLEEGIARAGYEVFRNGVQIGHVTSGTMSPTLNKAIAIVLVTEELIPGDKIQVQIRHRQCSAEVVKLPFISI